MSVDAAKSPEVLTPELAVAPKRLASLDAYRGAIMLLMASGGLGLAEIAKEFPDSSVWQLLGRQSDHAEWAGCTLWDLIQPAFMFMVGIALPWSLASRSARGQSFKLMLAHALWRSLLLEGYGATARCWGEGLYETWCMEPPINVLCPQRFVVAVELLAR